MGNAIRREDTPLRADAPPVVIAETAPPAGAELRAAPRFTLLIRAAKLVADAGEFLCVIRDASETGISARMFHPLPPGESMRVVLQNGDDLGVAPVWQESDRAGFRFTAPVDVARIIASPSRYARRAIRLNLAAAAVAVDIGGSSEAKITNLSQQGAAITSTVRFAIDQRLRLSARGMPETRAVVRWRKGGQYGLAFEDTYQFGELARIARRLQQPD